MQQRIKHGKLIAVAMAGAIMTGLAGIHKAHANPLPGKVDEVHKAFNKEAKKINANVSMVLTECSSATCSYAVTGQLSVIVHKEKGSEDKIEDISLIFGRGSDGASMILSMGILMIVYSPNTEKDERGNALTRLSSAITGEVKDSSVILGPAKYTMSNLQRMGLWFNIDGR